MLEARRDMVFDAEPFEARDLSLEFRGTAREYFRVWVVNLCLTLLTLGIFSAWAKVRKKRYFYSHTLLDGTPFQYLGQPMPIFKGRIVATILFLIYYFSSHFFTAAMPLVILIGIVLAPWVIARSAAFNARYSAFRNMTFSFDGTYLQAAKVFYFWGLVPVVAVAMLFDGNTKWILLGIAVLIVGFGFPWWIRSIKHFIVSHTAFGGEHGEFSATGGQFFRIYFFAGLMTTLGVALAGGLAYALFAGANSPTFAALAMLLPTYGAYVLAFAYVQAQTGNLVWNHTRLGPVRFRSTLLGRGLAKLYVTNALGIIVSAGLLIPWAVVRTLKYRVDHLHVRLEGDLAEFHAAEAASVQAAGAEVGEFFELDLSL